MREMRVEGGGERGEGEESIGYRKITRRDLLRANSSGARSHLDLISGSSCSQGRTGSEAGAGPASDPSISPLETRGGESQKGKRPVYVCAYICTCAYVRVCGGEGAKSVGQYFSGRPSRGLTS